MDYILYNWFMLFSSCWLFKISVMLAVLLIPVCYLAFTFLFCVCSFSVHIKLCTLIMLHSSYQSAYLMLRGLQSYFPWCVCIGWQLVSSVMYCMLQLTNEDWFCNIHATWFLLPSGVFGLNTVFIAKSFLFSWFYCVL